MLENFKTWGGLSFRLKVILTFSTITIALVGLMSWMSYHFVRNIYLNQLSDQVEAITQIFGSELDTKYLSLLPEYDQNTVARLFYQQILKDQTKTAGIQSSFIFDDRYQILAHSDSSITRNYYESRLQLNQSEIQDLKIRESQTSLPFKAKDGFWYMWGFYRLGSNHWLGIQESAARFAEVEKFSRIFLAIGLSGIVLAIFASWLLARSIAKPVEQLVSFSKMLGQGNFNMPIPKTTGRELFILAGAMDKMRSDLARHQQEKEEMLAQIAHEIRNPLGGIELLAGLIKEDLEKKNESSEYIQKIEEEIRGLKSLITAYVNYSRPASAKPEWVNPQETVEEVKELLKSDLEKKEIKLSCNGTSDPVWFDPNHLRQVLINLVSNSVEALNREGTILIQTLKIKNDFSITVTDNGPGISPEHQKKIFQPFYTTRDEGTGLGLSICQKLCQENGANINLTSNESGGCRFIITKENKEV